MELDEGSEKGEITRVKLSVALERARPMGRSKELSFNCVVCGDRSYGRHYGVHSCDGCACFFKRTVRRRLTYICTTGARQCIIDKVKRNWCPYCRFQKCLLLHMDAKGVQKERGPRKKPIPPVSFKDIEVFELSAEILITSVRRARVIPSWARLTKRSQDVILAHIWSSLFLLEASFWKTDLAEFIQDISPIVSFLISVTRQVNLSWREIEFLQVFLLCRDELALSPSERDYLKLAQQLSIVNLSSTPERLSTILCLITEFESISHIVEQTLFAPIIGPTPVSNVVTRI